MRRKRKAGPEYFGGIMNGNVGVLLRKPGIGDVVWVIPTIQAIARSRRTPVTVFARPCTRAGAVLSADPAVRKVVEFEFPRGAAQAGAFVSLVRAMRRERLSEIWCLCDHAFFAAAAAVAGVPVRHGFGPPRQRPFLKAGRIIPDGEISLHAGGLIPNCRRLLAANGIGDVDPEPHIVPAPSAIEAVKARFGHIPRPWVTIGCTGNDSRRCWIPESYASLLRAANAKWAGSYFLLGGPQHADQMNAILGTFENVPPNVINTASDPITIEELIALCALSDLFVGNDSGPMNIAAATGVPTFGIFGNARPHDSLSPRIRPILPSDGAPDLVSGMSRISPEQVMAAIGRVLDDEPELTRQPA